MMLIKKAPDLRYSDITPERLYLRRREFIKAASTGVMGAVAAAGLGGAASTAEAQTGPKLPGVKKTTYTVNEALTPFKDVTTYNNFYEFGTGKGDPARYAGPLKPRPWKIKIDGAVAKPAEVDVDELIKPHALEERIYRMRCVEAWSMVIPWVGIPLGDVLKRFQPTPQAKFVELTTLFNPTQMPGQRDDVLPWPYTEGLRMDEAMHPLAILAVGLYEQTLLNQSGAPIRLVVPWKYGFKGVKSIVRIRLVEKQPLNTWQIMTPSEYGFYANVNPEVDHPRWTQATERRIGEFFRRKTLMFNGYGDQVASLYSGMDLRKNY